MTILLTAAINAREVVNVARRDPRVRLNDYKNALALWLRDRAVRKIIFCENSCYDLAELERVSTANNPHGKEVEFLSFEGNNFPPQLGKGSGEMAILRHALDHSRLIKGDARVMKVTGRLYVRNAGRLIRQIESRPEVEVFCDFRGGLTYGDSRVFCTSPRFLETYLMPFRHLADESRNICVEHLLGRAIHRAMSDGTRSE